MEPIQETPLALPSFKRNNLVQMVFDALKENILAGKFKEGDCLPTQELLAQQFGVSRTVMREALNKLSSLGLIESHQGRGTFIRSPDAKVVMEPMFHALMLDETSTRELIETRYYLEPIIARLAAKDAEPQQITALQELIGLMEQHYRHGDIEAFAREDLAFHLTLAECSKNSILQRILGIIRDMLLDFIVKLKRTPGTPEQAIADHKKILAAVIQKDPDLAEQAMQRHILDLINILRDEYAYGMDV